MCVVAASPPSRHHFIVRILAQAATSDDDEKKKAKKAGKRAPKPEVPARSQTWDQLSTTVLLALVCHVLQLSQSFLLVDLEIKLKLTDYVSRSYFEIHRF